MTPDLKKDHQNKCKSHANFYYNFTVFNAKCLLLKFANIVKICKESFYSGGKKIHVQKIM